MQRVYIEANAVPRSYELFEMMLHGCLARSRGYEIYADAMEGSLFRTHLERFAIENEVSIYHVFQLKEPATQHIAFVSFQTKETYRVSRLAGLDRNPSIIIVPEDEDRL